MRVSPGICRRIHARSMSTQEIQPSHVETAIPPPVGGWLLVLCLILTCVYPARSGYTICWQGLPKLMDAHSKSPPVLYSVYCVLFAAVAVLSFITGSKLWSVRPGADRFARADSF